MKNFINEKFLRKLKNKWYCFKHNIVNLIPATYLCWKYPFLKLCHKSGFFQTRCFYFAIDKGWRKAFGMQLLKEMKHAAIKYAGKEAYKNMYVDDIKEKWGMLDINGSFPNAVWKVIHKYEYISMHTCIECGELATVRSTGWICPYCDAHVGDRNHIHFGHKHGPNWYGWSGNIEEVSEEIWKDEEDSLNKFYGDDDSTGHKKASD